MRVKYIIQSSGVRRKNMWIKIVGRVATGSEDVKNESRRLRPWNIDLSDNGSAVAWLEQNTAWGLGLENSSAWV